MFHGHADHKEILNALKALEGVSQIKRFPSNFLNKAPIGPLRFDWLIVHSGFSSDYFGKSSEVVTNPRHDGFLTIGFTLQYKE